MKFPYITTDKITPDMQGFYRISHEAYHNGPGLSSTRLKKALVSYTAYNQGEIIDSAALAFGRAFHAALVEPGVYAEQWVVMPQFQGHPNSNAYKADKAAWLESNSTRQIIYDEDAATIKEMIRVVKEHPEYTQFPKHDAEIMGVTKCLETGLQIKCKVDLFGHSIVDFKSTSTGLSPAEFINDMVKWRYHISAAFYQDIVTQLTGERLPFIVVPITKKNPECEFYQISDEILEEGRKLYKAALRRIQRWETIEPAKRQVADKRLRVLNMNNRVLYNTKDILEFVEGT